MTELIGDPIETDRATKLRDWLKKPEGHTLRTVIATRLRLAQEKALISGMKADNGNSYAAKSIMDLGEAQRYQMFLGILDDIANPDTPLETIKLKT